jgi:hypothetical protein
LSPSGMLFIRHFCFSSLPPFFRRGFRLKKRSNARPKWSPAPSRPRCQGRVGFAFTGAQRTPLTGKAGGLGAVFTQKGQISAKGGRSRVRRYAKGRLDFGRFDQEIIFSVCDGKFWRGSPHRRYQQLFPAEICID